MEDWDYLDKLDELHGSRVAGAKAMAAKIRVIIQNNYILSENQIAKEIFNGIGELMESYIE